MGIMGEVLGGTFPFHHEGKDYRVSLVTDAIKLEFERRLFQKARDVAREMRELMSREDFQAHLKQLSDDYIAGGYALESPRGLQAIQKVAGMLTLCALLFGCPEAEMLRILMARKEEVTSLLQVILHESFPAAVKDDAATQPS